MRKIVLSFFVCCLVGVGIFTGCSGNKATSSREAINLSKAMETVGEKTNYLVSQAKSFYNSKDFQGAIDIAQHILQYVDKDSLDAKNLLEKAKEQLKAKAEQALGDVKGAMGLGK
jgi:hypothetical protein